MTSQTDRARMIQERSEGVLMAEIVAFASGRGGTGKSTAAVNIGAALAKIK